MNDTPIPERDACDELLTPAAPPPADEAWRQALFLRSSGVLRRRLWGKRAGFAAALAACYLAGLATMRLWTPQTPRNDYQSRVWDVPEGDPRVEAKLAAAPLVA